jgi:hypothetical protein
LNFGKRVEYDNSLSRKASAPLPLSEATLSPKERPKGEPRQRQGQNPAEEMPEEISLVLPLDRQSVEPDEPPKVLSGTTKMPLGTVFGKAKRTVERRRGSRLNLSLPVYVTGYDEQRNRWGETTKTINVSRCGVAVEMQTRLRQGTVLHLSLPMPARLRTHGYGDHSYNIYGIVRRVQPPEDGLRVVGVELIGECPPKGYLEKPWATFHSARWVGFDRRLEPRRPYVEAVEIEYLDHDLQVIERASATTEDISRSGLRILVKATPEVFDYVRVKSARKSHSGVSVVRLRFVGGDGGVRLCLHLTGIK